MVPRQDKYSLISVSADEDDDIVIQAGARIKLGSDEVAIEARGVATAGATTEAEGEPEAAVPDADIVTPASQRPVQTGMITTEEDLKAPMPYANMQRIILIVFLLFLVAAIAYWVFIRPLGI